jgi:acyl carrier protein
MNQKLSDILKILNEIRPEADFNSSLDYINEGILDSLDIVILVDSIEKHFNVSIPGELIIPENFVNLVTISTLIEDN